MNEKLKKRLEDKHKLIQMRKDILKQKIEIMRKDRELARLLGKIEMSEELLKVLIEWRNKLREEAKKNDYFIAVDGEERTERGRK